MLERTKWSNGIKRAGAAGLIALISLLPATVAAAKDSVRIVGTPGSAATIKKNQKAPVAPKVDTHQIEANRAAWEKQEAERHKAVVDSLAADSVAKHRSAPKKKAAPTKGTASPK